MQWHEWTVETNILVYQGVCHVNWYKVDMWYCRSTRHIVQRLLNSPNLAQVGLSARYETWPLIGWCYHLYDWYLIIDLGRPKLHRILGNLQYIVGSCDRWELYHFPKATDSHLNNANGSLPAVGVVWVDCEQVYIVHHACLYWDQHLCTNLNIPYVPNLIKNHEIHLLVEITGSYLILYIINQLSNKMINKHITWRHLDIEHFMGYKKYSLSFLGQVMYAYVLKLGHHFCMKDFSQCIKYSS